MAEIITKLNTEDMTKAGVNFGHTVSKLHPKMKAFVSGVKSNVHMIDMDKSAKEFTRALEFIAKLMVEGKTLLLVGTKIQAKGLTKLASEETGMPYVTERWLGGTFTNFETISKRVAHFKDLEAKKAKGELEKYTKYEQMMFNEEIESLRTKFEGIKNMVRLPEAVLILDLKKDIAVAREAKRKGIKIVAIVDTNIDPTLADYPIYANDDAVSSIAYILEKVKETILGAK